MYRLIRFGATELEYYNQVDNIGSGQTPVSYIGLPEGGSLDGFGNLQKAPGIVERNKSLRLHASSPEQLEEIYFKLLSLRGKRDQLYRRTGQGNIHWMYARLVEIMAMRSYEQTRFRVIQDIDLRFACQEAFWRGYYSGGWFLDSGFYLDNGWVFDNGNPVTLASSPTYIEIQLGSASDPGRAPVRAIQFIINADEAITSLMISRLGGEILTYNGTIPAGSQLIIDTGAMRVLCTGVTDPYDNLEISPTADMAAWFTLQPGLNEITVNFTGGGSGSTIEFSYYEAWF